MYISCKPTSLVRDLEVFLENGYIVEKAVAIDQFPWTANCEVLTLLVKTDRYGKICDTATTTDVTSDVKINYREEEIPDCG